MRSLPVLSPLVDANQRQVSYLRISLTDRCNYRCTYCMPDDGMDLVAHEDVLTFEEIGRIVSALIKVGLRSVRLTGGEPTVRRDLVELVARLSSTGIEDLAMTTNGHYLEALAPALRQAGLSRLNVSVDTLDPERFRQITRRGDLGRVLAGIERAIEVGFVGTKVNVVAMKGVNEDELGALCEYAWERDMIPRFIEFMPMSDGALFVGGDRFLAAAEIRARLGEAFGPLEPVDAADVRGSGPARHHHVAAGRWQGRRVGLITAVTEPFCETCNRMRLSSTGQLHTCLAHDDDTDLRALVRQGASDAVLFDAVRSALGHKREGHCFTNQGAGAPRKHMVAIGG